MVPNLGIHLRRSPHLRFSRRQSPGGPAVVYVKIFLVAGGCVLGWMGIQEYRVSSGASAEPQLVELAKLESGSAPQDNHLKLEKHVAVYPAVIYSYSQSKYDKSAPKPTTSVSFAYYPVISTEHPFVGELAVYLARQKAAPKNQPPTGPVPMIKKFKVLVKTKRFKTVGDLPQMLKVEESLQGLVINKIKTLDKKEAELIKQSFPTLDLDDILIVEEGRKPSSGLKSWSMIIGGGVLVLAGVGLFLAGVIADRAPQPQLKPGTPAE
jgi:hypothetical protein